ncbi:MAG TPA: hypothetical protein VGQ06_15040 [Gemmatimonadales bacterium]|jgi:hypothetical protein|nr:hypothetical protein [Gemmatimonadales bacterium]
MKLRLFLTGAPLLAVLAAACTEGTTGNLVLAVSARSAPAVAPVGPAGSAPAPSPTVVTAGDSTVIIAGNDTLVIRSVEMVLREIELERVETADCDDVMENDDCEEFEVGPALVSLPLGTTATETQVAIEAPAGMFNELEFEVHKPDALEDAAFIAAHPAVADVSIRVTGSFSHAGARSEFTYITDLNEKQEIELNPPLTVAEGSTTNVTLRLDIARWFLSGDALVDPATANKGGLNEDLVKNNIRASIDAFRDDDHDGRDDDSEGT